jgi:hypothetical protein
MPTMVEAMRGSFSENCNAARGTRGRLPAWRGPEPPSLSGSEAEPAGEDHPGRRILHPVAYHPRRTTQPVLHMDQSWPTSGLGVDVLVEGRPVERLASWRKIHPLDLDVVDG